MDITKVNLTPQMVNSLKIIKTDLPVPSNFTQVINYYGQQDWIGLWVDFPKRLTLFDGRKTSSTLQVGWQSYLSYPKIRSKIFWLKQQGYCLIPPPKLFSKKSISSTHGILYQRVEQAFYLCSLSDISPFLNREVGDTTFLSSINSLEQEALWIKEFKQLAMQQSFRLHHYQTYSNKVIKQMGEWLDTYFSKTQNSDLESVA